jgi:vesicle-fusing ATPase
MFKNKVIDSAVDLEQLAKITKNYTGAELEAVIKSASSFAFNRVHNIMNFN